MKLTSSEVLYMEVPNPPLRCGNCMMFLSDVGGCSIHSLKDFRAAARVEKTRPADMVCGLYVPGEPTTQEDHGPPVRAVSAETSGLGFGRTTCANCRFGVGRGRCGHPALDGFRISPRGCCNAWTERPLESE